MFAEEARLDVSRALGYKDVDVYCVAPVLDDAPLTEARRPMHTERWGGG